MWLLVTWASIAFAGALGVLLRYRLGVQFGEHAGPWVTVAINIFGSFLLGLVIGLGQSLIEPLRTALAVGFLGGFTTFSTFSTQVVGDIAAGKLTRAATVTVLSVSAGVICAAGGIRLGELIHHITS